MSVAGRTLQLGLVTLVAGVVVASTAAAQTAFACHMRCTIPNYGACADVTQCQNAQRACIDGCMMSLGLPQGGSAKQPAGGYGADAPSADGEMLGHAKNWDTRAGAESGAVQSCQQGGHPGCKAIYSYRNRCVALAWSKAGRMTLQGSWFVAGAQVGSAAKADALSACAKAGFKDCFVRSFSCSGRAW